MKKLSSILCLFTCLVWFSGCEDFLDRVPKTSINESAFFNTVADLETYTNSLYGYLPVPYDERGSDNVTIFGNYTSGIDQVMMGNVSSSSLPGANNWNNWANLRRINFFLVNANRATGNEEDINHYIGIARYFRALFYYSKVINYSDVPWYDTPLGDGDEALYKDCDPRATVMNNVLADLEFAVTHIKPVLGNRNRINKYAALTVMARICLFEGSFRKYHAEINLQNDYQRFLEKAVWASEEVMNSGVFDITGDYGALFDSDNLNSNKEIILQQSTSRTLGVANNTHTVLNTYWGLSRSLMETYLMADGAPFTQQAGYDTKTYLEVFENRDPRFAQTFCYPGFKQSPQNTPELPNIIYGGYGQIKFFPKLEEQRGGWNMNYTSIPVYRYAENLLVFAEAKAELAQLTQTDLDKSVNKLRDRVNVQMPHLVMATANANPDPHLADYYPEVTGVNKGVILEIRRERRVELACEGLREEDLKRWGAGLRFADSQQGIYIPYLGAYDTDGDGEPDVAILENPTATVPIDHLTDEQKSNLRLIRYLMTGSGVDEGFYLNGTDGKSGHIVFTTHVMVPRTFESPKHYYYPIPRQQLILNPQLKQPFGWE